MLVSCNKITRQAMD